MDDQNKIFIPEAGFSLLNGLYTLKMDSALIDVTIEVGGQEFQAHKCVLAASSSYYKKMFTMTWNVEAVVTYQNTRHET